MSILKCPRRNLQTPRRSLRPLRSLREESPRILSRRAAGIAEEDSRNAPKLRPMDGAMQNSNPHTRMAAYLHCCCVYRVGFALYNAEMDALNMYHGVAGKHGLRRDYCFKASISVIVMGVPLPL